MQRESVLVRVTGPDRPGVLAGVLGVVDAAGAQVDDIEQITIRGHLDLNLEVAPAGRELQKELLLFGWEQGLTVHFEAIAPGQATPRPTVVVTVLANRLVPADLAAVAAAVAAGGGNIERIVHLSSRPVSSFELQVAGGDESTMRRALLAASQEREIDIAVQQEGLLRRATRLVVMDVDSTLIQDEVIDLLAAHAGCEGAVRGITERAMRGELDFEASLRERVQLLKGLPAAIFDTVKEQVRLTPGARTFVQTLRRLGYRTAIVSGGFTPVTDHLKATLQLDYAFANELEVEHGLLTGRVLGEVVDRAGKARLLRQVAESEGIALDQVVAIGDGANDLDMLAVAGLGVAFNAKPAVREAAQTAVNVPYLDAILFLLGVRGDDVERLVD